ncbi:MAG: hypothetical protein QNJ13_15225 [Paracoccaceae bacterium]|nr:hypothetical protein [Paracoccaceae bacterium]
MATFFTFGTSSAAASSGTTWQAPADVDTTVDFDLSGVSPTEETSVEADAVVDVSGDSASADASASASGEYASSSASAASTTFDDGTTTASAEAEASADGTTVTATASTEDDGADFLAALDTGVGTFDIDAEDIDTGSDSSEEGEVFEFTFF